MELHEYGTFMSLTHSFDEQNWIPFSSDIDVKQTIRDFVDKKDQTIILCLYKHAKRMNRIPYVFRAVDDLRKEGYIIIYLYNTYGSA